MMEYISLLQKMISAPSISRSEEKTADIIQQYLKNAGVCNVTRMDNNVIARNLHFNSAKPTILLNSHHDTVKPNSGYTRDPFTPSIESGVLYGLGSNDAGASVVALITTFLHFYPEEHLKYNLCLVIAAEEEVGGVKGIREVLPHLGPISFAIIGEPTKMRMSLAERGLMVLDCKTVGKSGHAAREEGINAIYLAMKDIEWFRTYEFPKTSSLLGKIKMSVTIINAGSFHNVIPAECNFVVDVRINEKYTNEEILDTIKNSVQCEVKARSTRLRSSCIPEDHPIVKIGYDMGIESFGSPTTSDAANLVGIPSLKMGPGDSARSHTADEYVLLSEIEEGIDQYITMLSRLIN